jgi:inosine/xanthosine triphosphatase
MIFMKKVIVASKNPVKINATKIGFEKMFGTDFEFVGISVPSGVPDQPISSNETLQGAKNRATNAQIEMPDADFWVGIEGGIEKQENDMECFAWCVVLSKEKMGKARTSTFFLPQKIVELVDSGMELGAADDVVFQRTNSKQANGAIGILTVDVIDRTSYYVDAAVLALIPFRNSELY